MPTDTSLDWDPWREATWRQFGASIDMVENAMHACPPHVWRSDRKPEFWYIAFHTLFWLDLYLSDSLGKFAPPDPFTLDELEAESEVPREAYTIEELQAYLDHGRAKCRALIASLTRERAAERCGFQWVDCTVGELLLYNMRHVQHGAAQLNLILRQQTDSAPNWVKRARR
jgi:uncharacterized damage-inducible protein DinB